MTKTYVDIIVDIISEKLDRSFQYLVPEHLEGKLHPGMQVQVPFGNGGRTIKGYVIRVTDQPSFDVSRMKEIREVETGSNSIESRLIALAAWIREQYGATMIQALKTVLPVKQKMKQKEERWIRLLLTKDEANEQLELCRRKHYVARQRLLEALLENNTISYSLALNKLHLTASVIKTMESAGAVRIQTTEVYRNPVQKPGSDRLLPGTTLSHRFTITSQNLSSSSTMNAVLPSCSAAMRVLPLSPTY